VDRGRTRSFTIAGSPALGEHIATGLKQIDEQAAAWRSLQGPLTQTQAVADLDTLAIARSPTAPLTPHGDHDGLVGRMLAIPPAAAGAGANAPTPE